MKPIPKDRKPTITIKLPLIIYELYKLINYSNQRKFHYNKVLALLNKL